MPNAITYLDESAAASWQRTLYAFLAEKERLSGSRRTVDTYSRMLQRFFGSAAKTPDEVTSQDVFAWAYSARLSGKPASSITVGARLACVSSFYHFLIRMKVVVANPCDAIDRPRQQESTARGLTGDDIQRLLASLPKTPIGMRDRAIILTLTFTGRRRAEVIGLTAGDISFDAGRAFYAYRGKGGKTGRRELPQPALQAIQSWLVAYSDSGAR
ncbi:MAG TPA: tyrosine-type recombinase/integrase [Dehalococcoidia bacterium]|nr:tyrosine-type recombinase/integrase [Dehalococcoidia bacterium]